VLDLWGRSGIGRARGLGATIGGDRGRSGIGRARSDDRGRSGVLRDRLPYARPKAMGYDGGEEGLLQDVRLLRENSRACVMPPRPPSIRGGSRADSMVGLTALMKGDDCDGLMHALYIPRVPHGDPYGSGESVGITCSCMSVSRRGCQKQ